jgi:hypothetical protein
VARAIYQAVARYYHGDGAAFLPEPPEGVTVRAAGAGAVELVWRTPPHGSAAGGAGRAERYRIHGSRNGLAFAPLGETRGTRAVIRGLPAGVPLAFRISALNAGGASLPSAPAAITIPLPSLATHYNPVILASP